MNKELSLIFTPAEREEGCSEDEKMPKDLNKKPRYLTAQRFSKCLSRCTLAP